METVTSQRSDKQGFLELSGWQNGAWHSEHWRLMEANHRFMIGENRLHVCLVVVKHSLHVYMALRALEANGDQPSLHNWLEHSAKEAETSGVSGPFFTKDIIKYTIYQNMPFLDAKHLY